MGGDWDILNLLLEVGALYDTEDSSKRLPQEYFDLERVNLEAYKAYHAAVKAWRLRWRSLDQKGKNRLFVLSTIMIFNIYFQT